MNIDELLSEMEEAMEDSFKVPMLGGKRMVDVEKVRDLIDETRRALPSEIKQARAIVLDRADIVQTAKKESEAIVQRAEDRARAIVSQTEIVKQSEKRAADIIGTAQQQAREVRNKITDYCERMLKNTEEILARSSQDVKNVRTSLRQTAKK